MTADIYKVRKITMILLSYLLSEGVYAAYPSAPKTSSGVLIFV